ncbi:MAG: DUF885 family protein, partial [bacterium]
KALRDQTEAYGQSALSAEQRFQQAYVLVIINSLLFVLDDAEEPFRGPTFYLAWPDTLDPGAYITRTYAPAKERMAAFTRYARNLPAAIAQIRGNLRMPMPATFLQVGIDSFSGFVEFFRNGVAVAFEDVQDQRLQDEFDVARENAAQAMEQLVGWLEANRETETENFALGPDLYRKMLYATELVDMSLEDLKALGRADLARNQTALQAACKEYAPGKAVRQCIDKMAGHKPEDGPIAAARRQLPVLKAFVIEQDLVSIPGNEEALVAQAPPYARSNAAYIRMPGYYEQNQSSIYYLSPPNPDWPKAVQEGYMMGESDLL